MEYFAIIQALCRAALSTPNDVVVHQVERLKNALQKDGLEKEAKAFEGLLVGQAKSVEIAPSRLSRSKFLFQGEELTRRTILPVDKESGTQLAEIVWPEEIPEEPPIFDTAVQLAIDSIITEWVHFEDLKRLDAQPTRSCLFFGRPGTGKTRLAFWIAKEVGLPIVVGRLDGLMSSYLGTTSRNIGSLFSFASKYRCVLLLDEFDAIAKLRDDPQEVGEIKRVVNTLLQNLDARKDIGLTIGITNHQLLLDPAIWRRFENQIQIPLPSQSAIVNMLSKFLRPLILEEVELKFLSWTIDGASGADIESLAKWLKKAFILQGERFSSFVDLAKQFAVLNNARIDSEKRALLFADEDILVSSLIADPIYGFKQKDVAALMGLNPSTLSKMLSKKNVN